MERKRTRIDIIHDILVAIQNKGGRIKPTHLMYKANLSHVQMNSYLEELVEKGFVEKVIEEKTGNNYLLINEKGYGFIQKLREMKAFEESFGL